MADQQIQIKLYETLPVVSFPTVLAPGPHYFRMQSTGNSVLSTVYVRAAGLGVTVAARWFDVGAGTELTDSGAQHTLATHPPLGANSSDRRIVTRIHNHPRLELIVAGGPAEVGVLATVLADFPISGNLLDGQTANLTTDGGLPIAVYDPSDGKFYLLRGDGGSLSVVEQGLEGVVLEATQDVSPGPEVTLLTATVPVGETWRVRYGAVVCRGMGRWRLLVNGVRVAGGATGPERSHDRSALAGHVSALSGQAIDLLYTYANGPAGITVDGFVGINEV